MSASTSTKSRPDVYPIGTRHPNLRLHPAVRAGDYIFVSGQVAKDEQGCASATSRIIAAGPSNRCTASSPPKGPILAISCTVYLEDARDFGRYNRVFADYFPKACLARTTVEARAVIDTKIEMDAIAY